MANYSDIKGFTVQTLSTDTIANQAAGGSWASGGDLNNGIVGNAGFGTYTAAVSVGGSPPPGFSVKANVEEYNGSSWTEVNNIPSARRGQAGFGTLTAGVICGGVPNSNQTFEYDGTNWTAGGNLGTGMIEQTPQEQEL